MVTIYGICLSSYCSKSLRGTIVKAFLFVAFNLTIGALPALWAWNQRTAHNAQRSPEKKSYTSSEIWFCKSCALHKELWKMFLLTYQVLVQETMVEVLTNRCPFLLYNPETKKVYNLKAICDKLDSFKITSWVIVAHTTCRPRSLLSVLA